MGGGGGGEFYLKNCVSDVQIYLELAKKPAFSSRVPVWMNNIYAYFEILIRLMQNGLFSTISNFINLNTRYKINIFFENGNTFK